MSWIVKKMSKITASKYLGYDLEMPNVKILAYNYQNVSLWNHPNCNSPFWYFWWNEQPGAKLHFNDKCFDLHPNIIVIVPPNTLFSTSCDHTAFNQFYIHFAVGSSPFTRIKRIPFLFMSDEGKNFVENINLYYKDRMILELKLYNIIYNLLLKLPEDAFLFRDESPPLDKRVEQAVEMMSSDQSLNLDNAVICKRINMSVNNFIRIFKHEMRMSPQRYLLMKRIERAQTLLLHTGETIETIAASTGFADRYHFSKAFKRILNITPVKYRNSFKTK